MDFTDHPLGNNKHLSWLAGIEIELEITFFRCGGLSDKFLLKHIRDRTRERSLACYDPALKVIAADFSGSDFFNRLRLRGYQVSGPNGCCKTQQKQHYNIGPSESHRYSLNITCLTESNLILAGQVFQICFEVWLGFELHF